MIKYLSALNKHVSKLSNSGENTYGSSKAVGERVDRREESREIDQDGLDSLLFLDLHGQPFHVRVFEVITQVLSAEVEVSAVRRKSSGRQRCWLGRTGERKLMSL